MVTPALILVGAGLLSLLYSLLTWKDLGLGGHCSPRSPSLLLTNHATVKSSTYNLLLILLLLLTCIPCHSTTTFSLLKTGSHVALVGLKIAL